MQKQQYKGTFQEFLEVLQGLEAIKKVKGSTQFALKVAKNTKEISFLMKPFDERTRPSAEFIEIATEVQRLAEEGKEEESAKLEEDNKHLVEELEKQRQEVKKDLNNETEVMLYPLLESDFPNEIEPEQVSKLLKIIE